MKNASSKIKERRNYILSLLSEDETHAINIDELAHLCDVSTMTVRRDIKILTQMGKVSLNAGIVELTHPPKPEGFTKNMPIEHIKRDLAKQAAKYIKEKNSIFINSSSTALNAVDYMPETVLTIITNNLDVNKKKINPNTSVIVPGGEIRFPKKTLVGDITVSNLMSIYADIAIIGCSGINANRGISTNNIHEARVNTVMVEHTNELVIVVADYRKIGTSASFNVAPIDKIDILITDIFADKDELHRIERQNVTVIQVDPEIM